jgi:hypothetical protein
MLKNLLVVSTSLLVFANVTSAQKTTLVVGGRLIDCPEFVRENTHMIKGIRVFEIPSNRLIYEGTSTDSSFIPRTIELNDVKVCNYRISYSFNPGYHSYQDKYITLKPIPINYVNFCRYDKNVEPFNPFSNSKTLDTVLIENSTTSCYDHQYSKTYFLKTKLGWTIHKEQYKVDCGLESKTGKIEVSKKPTHISKAKMVANEDINKIILALNKIRMLTSGGCTTNSFYTIKYDNKTLELRDGSCKNELNKILFTYTGSYY